MKSSRKITAVASIVLAASLGLAGCGDNGATGETGASQEQQQPANQQMTADNFVQRMSDAQYKAGSAHMNMKMNAAGTDMNIDADIKIAEDPKDVAMKMTMPIQDMKAVMILIGNELYMNMGDATQNKFTKLPDSMKEQMNFDQITSQMNPAASAEQLKSALKDFKAEAGEEIDGVKTTKYVLTVDTKKAMEASGQSEQLPPEALKQLGDTLTYEMYVGDADDLPRRMVMNVADTPMTANFSKWGEDVTIEAPAEDELIEMPGM
ncbi:DUF6612 family protein [Glutamicibacter sp. X7]